MLSCVRITQPRWHQRRVCSICRRFSVKPNHSPSKPKAWDHLDKECVDFLPWLERKAGVGISSKLYIGQSTHGRSLFASKRIREGECILTVPYNAQITSDNLLRKVEIMLGDKVREDIKLAIVLLVEQKIGPKSGWAPYISRLPRSGEMHSPIFWSEIELDMIRQSSLYHETVKQKAQLEEDFETIKPALECFSKLSESITFNEFKHAYALGEQVLEICSVRSCTLCKFGPYIDFWVVQEALYIFLLHSMVSECCLLDEQTKIYYVYICRAPVDNTEVGL